MAVRTREERRDLGAVAEREGTLFRVWAPRASRVDVLSSPDGAVFPLDQEGGGYFGGRAPLRPGALYKYRLDGAEAYPDPTSRFQPEGPHGASMVVDRSAYRWNDRHWRGVEMPGQVMYEMHVGLFTPEGTFDGAVRRLPGLQRLGVNLIELMPVAEWAGRWNWGYDGVNLFAPSHHYGDYDGLKRFVDAAHGLGIGVILDVVYNHFGPDGNYIGFFSRDYFTDRYETDWGEAINFDGPASGPVRDFYVRNACYWISEFHLDGLRLDATQNIYDSGRVHILAELGHRARQAAHPRRIILVAENEPQEVRCILPIEHGGWGLDGVWDDDFHHTARVALTGRREAYYTDYTGTPQELISSCRFGYLYQGQRYLWQDQPRGTAVTDQPACAFVHYLQNHDQVANSLLGLRLHVEAGMQRFRAMTALLLLAPETPMLFMGQEYASQKPFLYFADHCEDLQRPIREGRREFLAQFPGASAEEAASFIAEPCSPATYEACKLEPEDGIEADPIWRLHRDLLRLRREDRVIAAQDRTRLDGAVLGEHAFVLRYRAVSGEGDRLLLVNLGRDLVFDPAPEPLLAPMLDSTWTFVWSSDHPSYGGSGVVRPLHRGVWRLPGGSAILMRSRARLPGEAIPRRPVSSKNVREKVWRESDDGSEDRTSLEP
jgi:maltooligosyltrehalose trehalohydrolase